MDSFQPEVLKFPGSLSQVTGISKENEVTVIKLHGHHPRFVCGNHNTEVHKLIKQLEEQRSL